MPSSRSADTPRDILISMGEPAGIGPEVAVKAWAELGGEIRGRPLRLVGDPDLFRRTATLCGFDAGALNSAIVDSGFRVRAVPGELRSENANAVTETIALCVRRIQSGDAGALVTAPIQKSVLTEAGFGFPGHTEYLAALTGAPRAVMMLASHEVTPPLRVVPVTIHIALKAVFGQLTGDAIQSCAEITLAALARDFGIAQPRLALAGLNPHAGEDATMGVEDRDMILPVAERLRAAGHAVSGPLPADTLFHADARSGYDAALCMYHDQALIPIKTLAFWSGVNVTLGLPIVRTSPDHGTALGIAGRGAAKAESMVAAIRMAAEIADRREA
jgi:4-hydroxythreonine-4-phosphate dehydrogenase